MEDEQRNKSHKSKTTGNKALKKDVLRKKKAGIDLQPNRGSNVKAFQSVTAGSHRAHKFLRSVEKRESTLHMPTIDKTFKALVSEPPLLVAVVGPPGVGKTTLIRSMVKFYSNRNLQQINGPVTVVASRSRRITFFECPNTLAAMCDIAKVADLVLLMVDGGYGFEMETFEFLNIAQVHGFPRMFGVVSHLDHLKSGKALKKRKKFLRHRFWHEVAAGAKLICLSPMIRGMYRPNDVLNLHRMLITVEPKVASWRQTHACALLDRHEDITDPEMIAADPNCNRTIAFYGFSRGKPFKPGQLVHIPGLGDFPVEHISRQEDPCEAERLQENKALGHRMRHLSTKQKKLYAPYCDVGGITYDDDAIYIQEDAERGAIERSGEGLQLLRELQRAAPMDAAKAGVNVMRRPVVFRDEDTMELEVEEGGLVPSEEDSNDDDDALYSDDENVMAAAKKNDLSQFGVERPIDNEEEDDEEEDEEQAGATGGLLPRLYNDPDSVRVHAVRHDWSDPQNLRNLKDLCVTGNWESGEADGEEGEDEERGSKGYDSDDEDFEAQIKGEKPIKAIEDSEEDDDDSDGGEEDGERREKAAVPRHNALAGVSYDNAHPTAIRPASRKQSRPEEGDEDDYDILNDGEDGDPTGGNLTGDAELDGLVSTFLQDNNAPARKGALASNLLLQEEEDGITFAGQDGYGARRKGEEDGDDDGEEDRIAAEGGTLTEEQERILKKKMEKKKLFDENYDTGGDDSKKNMSYAYYHQLNRQMEEKKAQMRML
ncbi:ribosome biogenesis protein BMS1 [Angomonas deanei]|uniref:AARP2CN (NUC121) domain containing protein, putative n=1 Tax=Angomonas deanei TaxID=59799 RepID=A0A7G2CIF0_9TRYP|nr:ribosome biogenesis protein BMS1 [Angomonas deanei]CAD2218827.1 AARP2CN (NUC121) domain containing protein, putative [Angomonas deanei]|eukprot:EPY26310.1 ribosome biogenesis protein BMS1 [Angomonas deanei]